MVSDPRPKQVERVAWMVVLIITCNVLAFAYETWLWASDAGTGERLQAFVHDWGFVPREFLRAGSAPSDAPARVFATPLSAMFLHAGVIHLAGNLLYLWWFGRGVEARWGAGRFALFYLVCGLAAAAVQAASAPDAYLPSLGASGAVSGVLGASLWLEPGARIRLPLWLGRRFAWLGIPALLLLGLWFGLQLLAGLVADPAPDRPAPVAWWAHVGGFLGGLGLAALATSLSARRAAGRSSHP